MSLVLKVHSNRALAILPLPSPLHLSSAINSAYMRARLQFQSFTFSDGDGDSEDEGEMEGDLEDFDFDLLPS
jgi:hypothetical protein